MTNLEIIKYLAPNNPVRLAELLDDIYCNAWNCGSCAGSTGKIMEECEIDDFNEWLNEDATKRGYYYDHELEEWSKAIEPSENATDTIKHPIDYVRFRKSVCAYCPDPNCMRSQVEICDCHKFEGYY